MTSSLSLFLMSNVNQLPNPSKLFRMGDDAYFISNEHNSFGVADGFGVFDPSHGDNSSYWPREFMSLCKEHSDLSTSYEIAKTAYENLARNRSGSTTFSIVKLSPEKLYFYTLGDSSCAVLRDYKLVFKTNNTVHDENFPYQIGTVNNVSIEAGTKQWVIPEFEDTIICATKGLWKNVGKQEIERIATKSWMATGIPYQYTKLLAKNLADAAVIHATSVKSKASDSDDFIHENLHDTTVVASYVCTNEDQ